LARPFQQAAVPIAADSEPNFGELGFPGSRASAMSRKNDRDGGVDQRGLVRL
jgi:hypothetical protein